METGADFERHLELAEDFKERIVRAIYHPIPVTSFDLLDLFF